MAYSMCKHCSCEEGTCAIEEAVEKEREACAKIAEEHSAWTRSYGAEEACEMVAREIRKRKT